MAGEIQIIRTREFVRLDADRHLDLAASQASLRAMALACRKRGLDCALVDLRTLPVLARPHFTTAQLAALVGTFGEAGFTRKQRLALLYRHDVHGGIRNFAFISRLRGLQVRAFGDYEEAEQWLAELSAATPEPNEPGEAVPVTRLPGRQKKSTAGATSSGEAALRPRPTSVIGGRSRRS